MRVKGRPAQSETFPNRKEAQQWAQSIETAIREGRHFPHAAARRASFDALAKDYTDTVLAEFDEKEKSTPRFLTDEERAALLFACSNSEWRTLHTLVLLAITTGARKGELIRLVWADLDLKKGRALVRETKNDEQRTLPLVGKALEALGAAEGAGPARYRACRHMQLAYDAHRHLSVFIELFVSSGAARA